MTEHCVQAISLRRLAEISGISEFHLIRSFKAQYGMTPHAYLVNRRIECSRVELRRGTPIAEVVYKLGFADQAHLQRTFKRVVATTPDRYRRSVSFSSQAFKTSNALMARSAAMARLKFCIIRFCLSRDEIALPVTAQTPMLGKQTAKWMAVNVQIFLDWSPLASTAIPDTPASQAFGFNIAAPASAAGRRSSWPGLPISPRSSNSLRLDPTAVSME